MPPTDSNNTVTPFGEATAFALLSKGWPGHDPAALPELFADPTRPLFASAEGYRYEWPATAAPYFTSARIGALGPFGITTCRYCEGALAHVPLYSSAPGNQWQREDVLTCAGCGWWLLAWTKVDRDGDVFRTRFREASVHAFDYEFVDEPLTALRQRIADRSLDLRDMDPHVLERLVGSVFRDHLGVSVTHVGRSGDGGIDLLIADTQNPIAIQVKRRANTRTEGPAVVRELIGSMAIAGLRTGYVVTTADHFSDATTAATTSPMLRRDGFEVDLYTRDALLEIISVVQPPPRPWLDHAMPHHLPPEDRKLVEARRSIA